jgi:hypothetical protein
MPRPSQYVHCDRTPATPVRKAAAIKNGWLVIQSIIPRLYGMARLITQTTAIPLPNHTLS